MKDDGVAHDCFSPSLSLSLSLILSFDSDGNNNDVDIDNVDIYNTGQCIHMFHQEIHMKM